MTDRPDIKIELLSDPIYLSGARDLVASVAKRVGFDDLQCSKIALAVDEALCNVIRHGYERATDRPIWVSIWALGRGGGEAARDGLRIVIEDEARQVDPDALRGRELDDIRPGGLGVHIIREVMDEARWERRSGSGMRLTMTKRPGSGAVGEGGSEAEAVGHGAGGAVGGASAAPGGGVG